MTHNLTPHNLPPLPNHDGDSGPAIHDNPHPQLVAAARLLVRWMLDTLQNAPEEVTQSEEEER
jgi:hypothetical protein